MTVVRLSALEQGVWQVLLDGPDRLNAIDDEFIATFHDVLDAIDRATGCRVVILTGAGRGFCAGFDMKSGDYDGDPAERGVPELLGGQRQLSRLAVRVASLPQVVVAAVNGPAAGGGFALALSADIRLAASTASFVASNVRVGLSGGEMGLTWQLPRIVGEGRAAEILLTSRSVDSEEAAAIGLVTDVVRGDELLTRAQNVAAQITDRTSPFGAWMTKELLASNAGTDSLELAIRAEDRVQVLCNYTGDLAEAVQAFRDGRSPRWY